MRITSLTEILPEKANVLLSPERLLLEVPQGLYHSMAIIMLIIWYVSSGATLFTNKYILSHLNGDALSLGITKRSSLFELKLSFIKAPFNLVYL
jgi:hypothetical protein